VCRLRKLESEMEVLWPRPNEVKGKNGVCRRQRQKLENVFLPGLPGHLCPPVSSRFGPKSLGLGLNPGCIAAPTPSKYYMLTNTLPSG